VARADYHAIAQSIKTVLDDNSGLPPRTTVLIDEELTMTRGPVVVIETAGREAPEDRQSVSGGTRTRFLVRYEIWCYQFSLERSTSAELRDDLMGLVEIALITTPKLGRNDVNMSWLEGGRFAKGDDPEAGFHMGGEVVLIVDTTAVTG